MQHRKARSRFRFLSLTSTRDIAPRASQTELATIWLVAWAVRKPGILDPPASRGLAASLPLGSQKLTETMVSSLRCDGI